MLAMWEGGMRTWSISEFAIAIVMIAGIIGVVAVVLNVFNVWPPQWLINIFWIVAACFIAIVAIRIIASM